MNYTNLTQSASLPTIEAEESLSSRTSELLVRDDVFGPQTLDVVEIRDSFLMTPAVAGEPGQSASPRKPFWILFKLVPAMLAVITAAAEGIQKLEAIVDALQPSVNGEWQLTIKPDAHPRRITSNFVVKLNQSGHKLKGQVEKVTDGAGSQSAQHEPMKLTGLVSGRDVMLCYNENSTPGQIAHDVLGCFNLKINQYGIVTRRASLMDGPFFAADAPTAGKVVADANWKRPVRRAE